MRKILSAVILVCIVSGARAQAPPRAPAPNRDNSPRPLDPLTPAEQQAAARIAMENSRVRGIAGASPRVVAVQFISVKRGEQTEPAGRWAEVFVHNESDGGGARVLVDLANASAADVISIPERKVPIGPSDIDAAASLALESATVRRILGGDAVARSFRAAHAPALREQSDQNRIEAVPLRGADPDDPCTLHRCVALFFRTRGHYVALNQVVVDLTARRVYTSEGGRP